MQNLGEQRFNNMAKYYILILYLAHSLLNTYAQRPAQGPISKTIFNPLDSGYKLVWQDDFLGNELDQTKWKVRGIGKRALGFVSPKAVRVEEGFLKLFALKQNDSILISAVGTQDLYMPKFGYYECRAQLQNSPGVWGAFWLQSPKLSEGDDPKIYGAEIDIMEFFKKLGRDIASHNVHWGPYGAGQHTTHGMQSYLKGLSKGFHTFGLEWTPKNYVFYIDGFKFYEVTDGVSHTNEYIILSMEIPNNKKEIRKTKFPDAFTVDYVRVYQK